jgi:hypothetical protein
MKPHLARCSTAVSMDGVACAAGARRALNAGCTVANLNEFGDHATNRTLELCPVSVKSVLPLLLLHTRAVPSEDAVAILLPAGERWQERHNARAGSRVHLCGGRLCRLHASMFQNLRRAFVTWKRPGASSQRRSGAQRRVPASSQAQGVLLRTCEGFAILFNESAVNARVGPSSFHGDGSRFS